MKQLVRKFLDILFILRLYPGTRVDCPRELVSCSLHSEEHLFTVYSLTMETSHPLAAWLLHECEGPWQVRLSSPKYYRRPVLAFRCVQDAAQFRLMGD